MKTADHLTKIRGPAAKIMGANMNIEPKRDRLMGPVFFLAGVAFIVWMAWELVK